MVNNEEFSRFLQQNMYEIIECKDVRASSALYAYSNFLNKKPIRYDNLPLYLNLFETNNQYTVDALLAGFVPEKYLDFVRVPNRFVMRRMFEILTMYDKNSLYKKTLKVFFSFIKRVYKVPAEGYRVYPLTISELNGIGKYLDEKKNQNYHLNRDILDILLHLTELDDDGDLNADKMATARQASRIRSDYFDQNRSLVQSMTDVILKKSSEEGPGISPEGVFID